jgi:DNA invertase Pin-like site-specific DNA recombinase
MGNSTRLYLRASTIDQDASRAKHLLLDFTKSNNLPAPIVYSENFSGTKLQRPELNKLLDDANVDDYLLVESVDRLSRLSTNDWDLLKNKIKDSGLKLIVVDLPTTHQQFSDSDMTSSIMAVINNMLIDLLATMARLDQEKRVERIKQGQRRAKESGKVIGGRSKDSAMREKIKSKVLLHPTLNAKEIAELVKCGVASVYRVKKEMQIP